MSKQLSLTYQDKEYVLEFTRKSIEVMEKQGFRVADVTDKPMSTLPALFAGAFFANHRFVKPEVIEAIFKKMPNKPELVNKLAEMYNEPIEALLNDPDESEGNVDWTTSW